MAFLHHVRPEERAARVINQELAGGPACMPTRDAVGGYSGIARRRPA